MKRLLGAMLAFLCMAAIAQATAPTQRLRGSIESFDGTTIVLKENGGATSRLALADTFTVSEVVRLSLDSLKPGAFVGAGSLADANGKLRAVEILVFPEASRGSNEGHGPWSLQPGGQMTNATIAETVVAAGGRTLKLRYKDGEQTIVVPDDIPIVTLKPADRSLLVAGAQAVVTVQVRDGKSVALRAIAGRDGFAPPF